MPNITLSVDAEIIRRVRHLALDRHTTLTAMVREYLNATAAQEAGEREQAAAELRKTFGKYAVKMGRRTWKREDLYER